MNSNGMIGFIDIVETMEQQNQDMCLKGAQFISSNERYRVVINGSDINRYTTGLPPQPYRAPIYSNSKLMYNNGTYKQDNLVTGSNCNCADTDIYKIAAEFSENMKRSGAANMPILNGRKNVVHH